ncbi:glycosyltransferase family 87 protein [Argonema galeatum]|uniref:glycosyltransferase family 87 protein n=1 Tax=Argonema galeatum TaxID=2942762 RepID=UPI002013547C|nr:glycosyltransferase family 87 protein [Argonema galeatum]MCL1466266.1 DUF2029 domain-containing protein [Argonema galeatum A003/A1]
MENIPLFSRFMILILIWIMAIALLLVSAIKEQLGNSEWRDNSVCLNHPLLQRVTIFLFRSGVILALKLFFITITIWGVVQTLLKAYDLTTVWGYLSDFRWYYVASKMVLNGLNPYQPQTFVNYFVQVVTPRNAMPFVYPPNIIPLIFPLGYFLSYHASTIWVFANLLAIIFLIWGGAYLIDSPSKNWKVIGAITCFLVYGTSYSLSVGNVALIVSALVMWSIIQAKKSRNVLAGVLLGISTIKPPLAVLFVLYFLVKRRFKLVIFCVITALILTVIGLLMTGNSLPEFIQLYKQGYELFFQHFYNAPDKSSGRIDAVVIGYRLFKNSLILSKLTSALIVIIAIGYISFYIYRRNKSINLVKEIDLSEVSLIACLSLLYTYSQPANSSILVLAGVFLINELLTEVKNNNFTVQRICFWSAGFFCLLIHTIIGYNLLTPAWKTSTSPISITSIFKQTIAASPSYAIVGLSFCILAIAHLSLNKTKGQLLLEREIE